MLGQIECSDIFGVDIILDNYLKRDAGATALMQMDDAIQDPEMMQSLMMDINKSIQSEEERKRYN